MSDSTNQPGRKAYDALIKIGDAVETPDEELWVVTGIRLIDEPMLALVSACRDSDGRVFADTYDAATTAVPREFVTKVADARRVRRL